MSCGRKCTFLPGWAALKRSLKSLISFINDYILYIIKILYIYTQRGKTGETQAAVCTCFDRWGVKGEESGWPTGPMALTHCLVGNGY